MPHDEQGNILNRGQLTRREFLSRLGMLTATASLPTLSNAAASKLFFKISLGEWTFNKSIKKGLMKNLDFPLKAKRDFEIDTVEYVNTLFDNQSTEPRYLKELKNRCDDNGVKSLLILCDGEGDLGDLDATKRRTAVKNHHKWVDAAHFLGCESIRVNCGGKGTMEEVAAAAIEGLRDLSTYAKQAQLNLLVENHGGYSSDAQWLSKIIKSVGMPNCGTLPDFDNFDITSTFWYDRYKGVEELMPFAKAVSSKAINFDVNGNCVETDFERMLKIVKASGYRGYLGIEYEGDQLSEDEGTRVTKRLLERVGASL